jgi:hypothetical protein
LTKITTILYGFSGEKEHKNIYGGFCQEDRILYG